MPSETPARIAPFLLALAVVVAYAPSLPAGFLGYDDDWLIQNSAVMADASADSAGAILFDLGRDTRLVLGAEYLPVRDLVVWITVRAVGLSAPWLRALQLALFVLAALATREWLRALLGPGFAAEIAALTFALHPLHAESVAWLAGYKDVLALLFTALALAAYARAPSRTTRALVTLFTLLACFSKAVSVVLPALLLCHDAMARRRPDRPTLILAGAVAMLAACVHVMVGRSVGMVAELPGGSRLDALATMAPVAFRYAARILGLEPASIVHEVPDRTLADPIAIVSLLALIGVAGLAVYLFRRGDRIPAIAIAWFFVALLPVSQVIAPLQNRMADRYLLVALLGPCLVAGMLAANVTDTRLRAAVVAVLALALCGATAMRALVVSDPIALFAEASERAPGSAIGPYQLGVLLQGADEQAAERAFREALDRDGLRTTRGAHAADNLAILLARSGRPDEAVALLEEAHERFTEDPRVAHNLAVLLDARGEHERARLLLLDVLTRAPRYERARRSYTSRFGPPPVPAPPRPRFDPGDRAL